MSNQPTQKKVIQIKPIHKVIKQKGLNITENEHIEQNLMNAREELDEIRLQQEELLMQTKHEIETAKLEWAETRESYMKEAQQEGFESGFLIGKEEAKSEYITLIDQGNQTIDLANVDYNNILDSSNEKILDLAIFTAEKILCKTLSEYPEQFTNIVLAAIKEIKNQDIIDIQLSSYNYEQVLKQKEELQRLVDSNTKLSVHLKSELKENQCIIEHPYGKVDASVDTQLEEIHRKLVEVNRELYNEH